MFEGFEARDIRTHGAVIHTLVGGAGSMPLLLLHGYPQNHLMWHAIVSRLRDRFSLITPDLPGYGDSVGPVPDAGHVNYSKRAMAQHVVDVMSALGHERFSVAGHDRGGRVAYRLALDHPHRVRRLAVIDILPTLDVWAQINEHTAMSSYHWLLLAQPAPLPERLIGCDPDFFLRHVLDRWAGDRAALDPAVVAEYTRHFRKTSVITAACEDYRAGATIDLELDREDRAAGRHIECPTLVVWSKQYLKSARPPAEVWRIWARQVSEVALDCGHFIAEEQPDACAAALARFFAADASSRQT